MAKQSPIFLAVSHHGKTQNVKTTALPFEFIDGVIFLSADIDKALPPFEEKGDLSGMAFIRVNQENLCHSCPTRESSHFSYCVQPPPRLQFLQLE
jgi:hypothetical protein